MPYGWVPPPDPDKPNCPYVSGFKAEIRTHTPPPPFGGPRYPPATRPGVSDDYLSSVTQSQHVLSHPFRDTPTPPMPKTADLTVIRPLDIGNSRGAQVLLCSARQASHTQPFTAVAKIYDPLYYSFSASLAMGTPVDVVWRAESDYSKEAAAYEHLNEVHLSGGFAPKYFGSWTFTLPLKVSNKIHQRSVRLVLMEYIDGTSMLNVFAQNRGPYQERDAFHLDLGYRLEVLARLLDGVVRQSHAGLGQRDLAPRNVMLSPPPQQHSGQIKPPSRIVLLDYNNSLVYKKSKKTPGWTNTRKLPINPMQYFWNDSLDFAGWMPPEWIRHRNLFQKWLVDQFGGERRFCYDPVSVKLEYWSEDVHC
jgi:hypothetical protein